MYYFLEPKTKQLDNKLNENYKKQSSDLACNPEGYIMTDKEIESLNYSRSRQQRNFILYRIPYKYQENINSFIMDFWDGDVIIERIDN